MSDFSEQLKDLEKIYEISIQEITPAYKGMLEELVCKMEEFSTLHRAVQGTINKLSDLQVNMVIEKE